MPTLCNIFYSLLISSIVLVADGFSIFPTTYYAKPQLVDLAQAQKDIELVVRLDVGENEEEHMFLNGFRFKLSEQKAEKNHPVTLPGVNGPNPHLSSGAKLAEVVSCPSFIDMSGLQEVTFENGCWEMVWRDDVVAGALVCGFDVPKEVTRNSAKFPSGKIYLTFALWTKKQLAEMQLEKAAIKATAGTYIREKEEALEKYGNEKNILTKALHFRDAARAMEKYDNSGMRNMKKVPDNTDVFPINDNIVLTTKGTVWTKEKNGLLKGQKLLGSAILAKSEEERL